MSAMTQINNVVYIYGGFSSSYDEAVDNLWIFSGFDSGGHLECTLVASPSFAAQSGWTDKELTERKALIQKGIFPGTVSLRLKNSN